MDSFSKDDRTGGAEEVVRSEAVGRLPPDAGDKPASSDGAAGEGARSDSTRPDRRDEIERAKGGDRKPEGSNEQTRKPGLLSFPRRHPLATILILVILAALIAAAVLWWLHARRFESTDDAFIDARTVTISAEVAGQITDVPVTDNQRVAPGAVLVRIDDSDYRAALLQAEAQVAEAAAAVANADAQIGAQAAKIDQARKQAAEARAALDFARSQNGRDQQLLKKGAGTAQAAQQSATTLQSDQAAYDSAEAAVTAAEKQDAVLEAGKKSAEAQLAQAQAGQNQAEVTLSRTEIHAPAAGHVASISAAKGGYAQPGQALMMFVPETVWVTANFKETQLDLMRPGQPVDIEIDAYPERDFHGHVDSIQAGSGTAFSLLPPENATGNYVKVVQRVPVKIVFDTMPDVYLGPGMSVVPTVKVR